MPDEVCAYKYLSECYLECDYPGEAKRWYEAAVEQEPMSADNELLGRIKIAIADSLLDDGNAEAVVEELAEYLARTEKLSGTMHWQSPKLYMRLGTAYHMLGQMEQASLIWRRALDFKMYGYYVNNMELMMIADSLRAHDSTFNYDSLSAALSQRSYSPADSVRGWLAFLLGVIFSVGAWFFVGIFFALPAIFTPRQPAQGTEPPTNILRHEPKDIALNSVKFAGIPCLLIPLIAFLIAGRSDGFLRWLLLTGLGAGLTGVLAAFFDARYYARKNSVSMKTALFYKFVPLWLALAVLISAVLAVFVGLMGITLFFMSFF